MLITGQVELRGGPKGGVIVADVNAPTIDGPHHGNWGGIYQRTDDRTRLGLAIYRWQPDSSPAEETDHA